MFKNATIQECLKSIEKNKHRTLVVVDESMKLLGTITDGDIRKALINRISIDSSIQELVNYNCVSIDYNEQIEFSVLRKKYPEIIVFPVVQNGIVVGIKTIF